MLRKIDYGTLVAAVSLCSCLCGFGANAEASTGQVEFSAATYATSTTAGKVVVTVERVGGASGAAHVRLLTHYGTALDGIHFLRLYEWFNWVDGDATSRTASIEILNKEAFTGTLNFSVQLDQARGAALGSPAKTEVVISSTAPAAGVLELSAANYSAAQTAKSVSLSVGRKAGTTGAVSVHYSTHAGTAVSGGNYTDVSGVLNWANGDAASKTVVVPIVAAAAFSGSKTLTFSLSNPAVASLSAPSSATVAIDGTAVTAGTCAKSTSSWTTTGAWDSKQFGDYVVNNDNWGGTPGQQLWANDAACWGVTTTATNDVGTVRSYPSVTRGWSQNGSILDSLSTPGTSDWTVKAGMGISVTKLLKAKVHWAFSAPSTPGIRWLGLQDIYFHRTATPAYTEFPPVVDLMIDQSLADQVVNSTTFYALVAEQSHATTVTLGGNRYLIYIDSPGEAGYHQSGGHTVHLFNLPTSYTSGNGAALWGAMDAVNDVAAVVKYLMQPKPLDDAGKPLLDAAGAAIGAPLITPDLYLNAINAGWEIDNGTEFTNKAFCVAMQNEPDCP